MSKAFTSILLILTIIFVSSTKLSEDIQAVQHIKKLMSEEKQKLNKKGSFLLVKDSSEDLDNALLLKNEIEEQKSTVMSLDQTENKVVGEIGVNVDNSLNKQKVLQKVETTISEIGEDKSLSDRIIKIEKILSSMELRLNKLEETEKVREEKKREQRRKNNRFTTVLDQEEVVLSWNHQYILENVYEFAEAIKDNTTVKTLVLYNNSIKDEKAKLICEALKVNKSITTLKITEDHQDENCIKPLTEALKVNDNITSLELTKFQIGIEGAKSLGEALKINKSITTLRLVENEIGELGVKLLSESISIIL